MPPRSDALVQPVQGLSPGDLTGIIVRAKQAYACRGMQVADFASGRVLFEHREGSFLFRLDECIGPRALSGQATLDQDDVGRHWDMQWRGHLLPTCRVHPRAIYSFLGRSLRAFYQEGRFLGGFTFVDEDQGLAYSDVNEGSVTEFRGQELVAHLKKPAHVLNYFGGTHH